MDRDGQRDGLMVDSGADRGAGGVDALLADGRVTTIRPMRATDLVALGALHDGVSDEARRLRFFAAGRGAGHAYVEHLRTSTDTVAFVAESLGDVVALATGEPVATGVEEVAFLVAEGHRGLGLGSLLLDRLAADARDRGVGLLVADVLPENHLMIQVFLDVGFEVVRDDAGGVVRVELDPRETPRSRTAVEDREARAERRSLRPLLHPASVAVVGVRRDGTGVGAGIVRSVRGGGFRGRLCVIHPGADEVSGVPAYAGLAAVPDPVDLVVVAVPGEAAVATVEEAGRLGIGAAVVVSSGFGELGPDGVELQRRLLDAARRHSLRLVGPNCLGLVVNDERGCLNATFQEQVPPAGGLAIASQSGGVGIVLMDLATRWGLGIGGFLSLGNKADVSGNDLLAAWRDDEQVHAVALYLESFGNARRFARLALALSLRKPLLVVVGGRSDGGQRAGSSHTAASASSAVGLAAVLERAGAIVCGSAEQLATTALVIEGQPRPRGRRLGVLSNAGGMGVLAADAADAAGLQVPAISPARAARIARHVTGTIGTGNPVDTGAAAPPADLAAAAGEMLVDDELDALLVVLVATGITDATEAVRALAREVGAAEVRKPVLLVTFGGVVLPAEGTPGITVVASIAVAVEALAGIAAYEEWRSAVPEPDPMLDPARAVAVRREAARVLARAGEGFVPHDVLVRLLGPFGLAPEGEVATGAAAAAEVARRLGGEVAVKVESDEAVHKTDAGLVRIGLAGPGAVAAAVSDIGRVLGRDECRVVVQPMRSGVEIAVGLVQDPTVGPLVMVAAGGVATDVLDDRRYLLAPTSPGRVEQALRSLRCWPLLAGHRGRPPGDVAALVEVVVAVGELAAEVPEVAELDLNPVMVDGTGAHLVDVRARLCVAAPATDLGPHLRPRR